MRSKKLCYILLSALFIMLGLSLNVCLDTNAKQYDVVSVPYSTPSFPTSTKTDPNTGNLVIDWGNYSDAWSSSSPDFDFYSFYINFYGDSYYSDLSDLKLSNSFYRFSSSAGSFNSDCSFTSGSFDDILKIESNSSSSLSFSANLGSYQFSQTPLYMYQYDTLSNGCIYHFPFGQSPQQGFDRSTVPIDYYARVLDILPYFYTSDGLFLNSSAIDSDSGIHYSHSFKFSDLFNQKIKKFSRLSIPIWNYDDFWIDGNNFTAGRDIEFKGIFEFTDSFSFHENINTNGSSINVHFIGYTGDQSWDEFDIPCTINSRSVPAISVNWLEYSCKYVLPHQYVWVYPALVVDGANNYFWTTNGDTTYAQSWFITDNDTTPGGRLGDNLSGNYIVGDAKNDMGSSEDNADWFSSLKNLFNFNMINPFTPIFSLFTSQESCAQIPTLSEFLHSEETQVCPFFSSRIRSVVTPVLGLSAMMLVFGFAVRWLGARSGNFFEDSGSIAPPGDFPAGSAGVKHVGWRRK